MHVHITGQYGLCSIVRIKIVIRNVVKVATKYVDIDAMHQINCRKGEVKMKYEYMVVYSFNNGTGRICITRDKEILNYDDVESLDKTIRETNGITSAFAIDFKLLRKYAD